MRAVSSPRGTRGAIALLLALGATLAVLQVLRADEGFSKESWYLAPIPTKTKPAPKIPVVQAKSNSTYKIVDSEASKAWPPKLSSSDENMVLRRTHGDKMITDGYGRTVLLHGVNVVFKRPPWLPDFHENPINYEYDEFHQNKKGIPVIQVKDPFKFDASDVDQICSWGFNWVRLGIFWPAIEPKEGHIDTTHYLPKVAEIVKLFAGRGVYTLLELHQDIGSRLFCGEGMPSYYIEKELSNPKSILSKAPGFPYPENLVYNMNITIADVKDREGYCMKLLAMHNMKGSFGVWSNTAAVGALWKTLFTPGSSLFKGYVRVWEAVAKFFAKEENWSPYISGFELWNEPSATCVEKGCWLQPPNTIRGTTGSQWAQDALMNLYVAASTKIRVHLPKVLLYFEIGMDMYTYTNTVARWGKFKRKPVPSSDPNAIVAYHSYYCVAWHYHGKQCRDVQTEGIQFQMKYADSIGAGAALTEFGSVGENQPLAETEIAALITEANDNLQSWAYWTYESVRPWPTSHADEGMVNSTNGHVDLTKFYMLTQPFCRAVQGRHISMKWDPDIDMKLKLKLHLDPTIGAPTEVYLGSWNPKTVSVTSVPPNVVTFQREGSVLYMFTTLTNPLDVSVDVQISMEHKRYVGPPHQMTEYFEEAALKGNKEASVSAPVPPVTRIVAPAPAPAPLPLPALSPVAAADPVLPPSAVSGMISTSEHVPESETEMNDPDSESTVDAMMDMGYGDRSVSETKMPSAMTSMSEDVPSVSTATMNGLNDPDSNSAEAMMMNKEGDSSVSKTEMVEP